MPGQPSDPFGHVSYAQLEALWIRAGGPARAAPTAAAIALAESQGIPSATNPNDDGGRQTSWGLWQISNGTHSPPAPDWQIPLVNARLAVAKYKAAGNKFTDWGTYQSGAYRQYMNNSTTPDFSRLGGAGQAAAAAGSDPACAIPFGLPGVHLPLVGEIGGGHLCLLRKTQARALLGGLLIAAGGFVLFGGAAVLIGRGLERTQAAQIVLGAAGLAGSPYRAAGRQFRRRPAPATQAPAATPQAAAARSSGS